MSKRPRSNTPPHCPNEGCPFHCHPEGWHVSKIGFFHRKTPPYRIQRFKCLRCTRSFSTQTFSLTYWLKKRQLLPILFVRILSCSGFRQIARELHVAHATVMRQIARLGRHCLLFQFLHRPRAPLQEPLVIDGFETFEFSQYWPYHINICVGAHSHFFYAFTDSELRRKGRMSEAQRLRRTRLEQRHGRPDPKAVATGIAELIDLVIPRKGAVGNVVIHSDEHKAYPQAFRRRRDLKIDHRMTPSVKARTTRNPLFPANLLDTLMRHGQANHKRETIAFSKRRQSGLLRTAILQVWRNFMKPFSENKQDESPAERLGLIDRKLRVSDVLDERLFPAIVRLPGRLMRYYRGDIPTRQIPNGRHHDLRYAF